MLTIYLIDAVTLCAVSAALAACTTSLLCILILRDNNTFGTPEPDLEHQHEVPVQQLDPTDIAKQLRHNRAGPNLLSSPEYMERGMSVVNAGDGPRDDDNRKIKRVLVDETANGPSEQSSYDTKNLDFAIIGWPKVSLNYCKVAIISGLHSLTCFLRNYDQRPERHFSSIFWDSTPK